MEIKEIKNNKKDFLDLLLLADEQEDMIDRYLERGRMFVLDDDGIKAECVVTDEGDSTLEIKNIATKPGCHGKGYGKKLIEFVEDIRTVWIKSKTSLEVFLVADRYLFFCI